MLKEFHRILDFEFFDGIKKFNVKSILDNWLTSIDFEKYRKSHIKVAGDIIILFDGDAKLLTSGEGFSEQFLQTISESFGLKTKKRNGEMVCLCPGYMNHDSYLIRKYGYILIFALGGTKSIESIYIHGLWALGV